MKTFKSYTNGLIAKLIHKRKVTFNLPRTVISFSFDDFPTSALENGGKVLEAYNLRGTFYASAGLRNTEGLSGLTADNVDLAACVQRGHELACHTYDHIDCSRSSNAQIAASIEKNRAAIEAVTGSALEQFAYPYGTPGLAVKKIAMHHYRSARSTQSGINRNTIDLGLLKASELYSRLGQNAWRPYLDDLMRKPGWLIFYTHDVAQFPSDYGCTIEELQTVVVEAMDMGYDILPVGEVVRRLTE